MLDLIPQIKDICNVEVKTLFSIDSTSIYYKHWMVIAKTIKENYDNYDGFIIAHGTDTMSYTASALSYLVQNSKKPIVIKDYHNTFSFITTRIGKTIKQISFSI